MDTNNNNFKIYDKKSMKIINQCSGSKLCREKIIEIIPTKNKLPQLPEEIVAKIIIMTYGLRPHPTAALIEYEKDIIRENVLDMMNPELDYYNKYLGAILGRTKIGFINWWLDKIVYKVKYRVCAEEIIAEVRADMETEMV